MRVDFIGMAYIMCNVSIKNSNCIGANDFHFQKTEGRKTKDERDEDDERRKTKDALRLVWVGGAAPDASIDFSFCHISLKSLSSAAFRTGVQEYY